MENKRGSWGSNIGFLMAAVGSAVGLGNIWGFPYKMGKSGGFTFLLVYLLLGLFVGFVIMMGELALGRRTGMGIIGAYNKASKKFKWVGWLGVISPFLILTFYCVLGGYCLQYMCYNLSNIAFNTASASGNELFGAMLTNPWGCVVFTLVFVLLNVLIVKGGISGGLEKFNTIGMPALAVMLIIIIIRAVTMDGAVEGLKFMFVPGYAVKGGFIEEAPNLISVLATAGGQMFFSLSLAMGAMITYGSYLGKSENLVKNSVIIVISDTAVALMAGLAVIPSAVAYGLQNGIPVNEISLSGPKLLFVTMQNVFGSMGMIGAVFGVIFFVLVLIAAISSSISLLEVLVTYVSDRQHAKNKTPNRSRITWIVTGLFTILAILVAWDCLGSSGIWGPGRALVDGAWVGQYGAWSQDWLDFFDCIAEGIAMPLGAMFMAIMIGWELKPKYTLEEISSGAKVGKGLTTFFTICIRFVVPVVMVLVLLGQLNDFFGLGWFN